MSYKPLMLVTAIFSLLFASCNMSKKPQNVRELMESDGWEYCQRVVVDCYYDRTAHVDDWIFEDSGEFDLFKKGNDYALTRTGTDNIPLADYEKEDEHVRASTWINYHAVAGYYTIRAEHARKGTGKLGIVTKHYNIKARTTSGAIYFNVNILSPALQPSGTNEDRNNALSEDNDVSSEPNEPQQKYKQCPVCHGGGRCGGCGGGGQVYNSIDYNPGQYVDCGSCGGSGACGFCEGTGIVEDLGW